MFKDSVTIYNSRDQISFKNNGENLEICLNGQVINLIPSHIVNLHHKLYEWFIQYAPKTETNNYLENKGDLVENLNKAIKYAHSRIDAQAQAIDRLATTLDKLRDALDEDLD